VVAVSDDGGGGERGEGADRVVVRAVVCGFGDGGFQADAPTIRISD
jgi:hypothetical protein